MVYLLALVLTLAAAFIKPVSGQPEASRGFPFITNYSPDDYAGHVQNWGFASDADNLLYIANMASVIRFDGVNWMTINVPGGRVLSIANDDQGRVYVGGIGEFGFLVNDAEETNPSSPVTYQSLTALIPDSISVDNVWSIETIKGETLFHSNNHLFHYDGDKVTVHHTDTRFTTLFVRNDHFYVRESGTGVSRLNAGEREPWEHGDLFAETTLQSYLEPGDGQVFCSFYECFFFEDEDLRPMETAADDYIQDNYIDNALVLSDGSIAIATRNGGIVQLSGDGELIRILNETTGLINNAVYGLYEDEFGSLWVATVDGFSKIDLSLPFRRFDHRHGIHEYVRRMTIFDDTLFLTSSAGVYRIDDTGQAHLYDNMTFCNEFMHYRNELYVTCTGALYRYGEDGFEQWSSNDFADIVTIYEDNTLIGVEENSIFLAEMYGQNVDIIYRIDDIGISPNSILADRHGNVWIGTETNGLLRVRFVTGEHDGHDHHWDRYLHEQEGRQGDERVYVTELNDQPAFLTWGMGIQRYDAERDTMFLDTRFGEPFNDPERQFFWAREDDQGNVWFRTNQRYQVVWRDEQGGYRTGEPVLNSLRDRQSNSIHPDSRGKVWYVTEQGLVVFDPDHNFQTDAGFHAGICEVFVHADSLIAYGATDDPVELDYDNNELRFQYAAASYHLPELTRYRVMLEGFDGEWSDWSPETRKDYTNIPEGVYRFRVEARDVFGTVAAASTFHLRIHPPWYRTIWAYLLYVLLAAGVLFTAYRIRLNQILRVHRIRNRIASDLHDEISATLSSISFFAKAIESDKTRDDKQRFVKLIADSAGEAKEKISDIVWAINPEHDDWTSFLSRCRRYTSDLLESRNISYKLDIDHSIPGKIDMQMRQHLWLIYKEMVMNAVRHSGAGHLHVAIRHTNGKLVIIVQDDGSGMNLQTKPEGNGIYNIRRRAESLKADVKLDTEPGWGTRWKLTFNW